MESGPIKRHVSIQAFSRDHHHALMLIWKIRKALREGVDLRRVDQYVAWFFEEHIRPHFEMEEQVIFPVLGSEHELVVRALYEHKQLMEYFRAQDRDGPTFNELADLLEKHIRFEERVLFNVVQEHASEAQLKLIEESHSGGNSFCENETDAFWK